MNAGIGPGEIPLAIQSFLPSPTTIRSAVDQLAAQGVIERRPDGLLTRM